MFSYHKSLYEFYDLELNEAKEYVTKLYDSKTINYHYADILRKMPLPVNSNLEPDFASPFISPISIRTSKRI